MKTIHVKSEEKVRYNQGRSEYAFRMRYHRRFPWWWLLLLLLIPLLFIPFDHDIHVLVVDGEGEPIDSVEVSVTGKTYHLYMPWRTADIINPTEYTSSEGTAVIPGMANHLGIICRPFLKYDIRAEKGCLSASESYLFHWRRHCTLVLDGQLVIEVRSRKTDEPIPGASVSMTVSDTTRRQMTLTTDENGIASYTIHDPEGKIDTLLVAKYGYSGVREINLDYVDIDDLHHVVYLDPPKKCGWTADNDSHTESLTIMDYDMGQVGGRARFDYYTDVAPDIIEVYDGSSSEYMAGTAPLLFRYDEATCTDTFDDSVMLAFKGQYLCVVVHKLSTYWGYRLNCPE